LKGAPLPGCDYDLLVVGSGPAGLHAAVQAAKVGKRAAVVERSVCLGGVCVNTGTIPSKTLREAVVYLTGLREQTLYGESYTVKSSISMGDLRFRCQAVMQHERDVARSQLERNGVTMISGSASFLEPNRMKIDNTLTGTSMEVTAEHTVLAVGSMATRPANIPFDGERILDSDDILQLDRIPRSLVVVGAGVIGCEFASIFAALKVHVTLIDRRPKALDFVDSEVVDALLYHLREQANMSLLLGDGVDRIEPQSEVIHLFLDSGKRVVAERVLHCAGRSGATDGLNLAAAGLTCNNKGSLEVDENYQTCVPGIYAAGDVVGFPSLASTSMEQGRVAACHAFGIPVHSMSEHFPYGIYTIPEISMVGRTEESLTGDKIPYESGRAHYREIARGLILGDVTGFLKVLFHLETRQLLGVHIIGEGATELVHIGQAVMALGGTLDYFLESVFNYPTLAEAYKIAALNAYNRMTVG
jgi:NAD(P) transhydrogenase